MDKMGGIVGDLGGMAITNAARLGAAVKKTASSWGHTVKDLGKTGFEKLTNMIRTTLKVNETVTAEDEKTHFEFVEDSPLELSENQYHGKEIPPNPKAVVKTENAAAIHLDQKVPPEGKEFDELNELMQQMIDTFDSPKTNETPKTRTYEQVNKDFFDEAKNLQFESTEVPKGVLFDELLDAEIKEKNIGELSKESNDKIDSLLESPPKFVEAKIPEKNIQTPHDSQQIQKSLGKLKEVIDKLGNGKKVRESETEDFVVKEEKQGLQKTLSKVSSPLAKVGLHRTWRTETSKSTMEKVLNLVKEAQASEITEIVGESGQVSKISDLIQSLQGSEWGKKTLQKNPQFKEQLDRLQETQLALQGINAPPMEERKTFSFNFESDIVDIQGMSGGKTLSTQVTWTNAQGEKEALTLAEFYDKLEEYARGLPPDKESIKSIRNILTELNYIVVSGQETLARTQGVMKNLERIQKSLAEDSEKIS